ncbi:hypothetical protein [Aneurinibacillus sp. UBA3580]|jgi:hypothetical protein|uniref:hypothetical protein n=1 Tax=Aneurinibacillus sp. UBA3580 TaxID=1946041 RepID=UPI00257C68D0|nr:hypothetical protein [Aneurinibacillus sp. UBA3580]
MKINKQLFIGMKLTNDDLLDEHISYLFEHHFLKVRKKDYIVCQDYTGFRLNHSYEGCGQKNYITKDNFMCSNCGNDLSLLEDSLEFEHELIDIDFTKIIEVCLTKLRSLNSEKFTINLTPISSGLYHIKTNSNEGLLVFNHYNIDTWSLVTLTNNVERVLWIEIDGTKSLNISLPYCRTYTLKEFTNLPNSVLKNELNYLPENSETTSLLSKMSEVREKLSSLSTSVNWQKFENEITDFLLDKIRSKHKKIAEYNYLRRFHNAYSEIFIQVGGAGNTDYRPVRLDSYLDTLFNHNVIIDAKRFSTSEINNAVLEKIEHHMNHDPSGPSRAIIITTKDKVACWNEIENWYRVNGYYKIIVLTPKILSHILCFFEIEDDVLEYLASLGV